jgi:hypothetical protein
MQRVYFGGESCALQIIMQGTPSAVPTAVVQGVSTILNLLPPVEDSEKATQEAYFRYKRDKYVNAARYLSDILFLDKNIQCDAVPIGEPSIPRRRLSRTYPLTCARVFQIASRRRESSWTC